MVTWIVRSVALTVLVFALQPAPGAWAQDCPNAPTVAAVDQYCEPTLDAEGTLPSGGKRVEDALSPAEVRRLEGAGPIGRMLLRLPLAAPATAAAGKARIEDPEALLELGRLKDTGRSGYDDAFRALAGTLTGPGLGGALGWGLMTSSLMLVAVAWLRARGVLRS